MNMLKCDPRVFAQCPYKGSCVRLEDATFMEDSDCERFNKRVLSRPVTNGDRIRMMNDAELSEFLYQFNDLENVLHYCQSELECSAIAWEDRLPSMSECRKCLAQWLRSPAYEKAIAGKEEKE